jgi:uncharacterized protein YkwD
VSWLSDLIRWLSPVSKPPPLPPPVQPQPDRDDTAAELLAAHNAARAARALAPLTIDGRLVSAALGHANRMALAGRFAHEAIGDGTLANRVDGSGYPWSSLAENIGLGQLGVAAVMASWMGSAPHAANILGDYTDFGGAAAVDAMGHCWWCAVFAVPK